MKINKNIILVTGAAGFIGNFVCLKLLERGDTVIGVDNHNDYYDPVLKNSRLNRLVNFSGYVHYKVDLINKEELEKIFVKHKIQKVINLAAQAGVQYSMINPQSYINSNIVGFGNILENCRHFNIKHLVYASTSSVYGANTKMPFSEHDNISHPLSLYAASKISNELMAHSYSYLYKIPTTGLRFFTVYGPWGRPDMALFKFTKNILNEKPLKIFNFGKHTRDFTYIDDIVQGVIKASDQIAKSNPNWDGKNPDPSSSSSPWRIYNIGNNKPVQLMEYVRALEKTLGKKAKIDYLPLQKGDVPNTYASIDNLVKNLNYRPTTTISEGVENFVKWYMDYYKK